MQGYIHQAVQDGGLNAIKTACNKVILALGYSTNYSAVNGANKIAEAALDSDDFVLSGSDGATRTLTANINAKSGGAAAQSTQQYDNGTATGGSTTTLADTGKSWTTNVHAGRAVRITAGTGAGQVGIVASNTGTVLTIMRAWAVAPDATSVYKIVDNLTLVFVDTTSTPRVLWVVEESTDQIITAPNVVTFTSNPTLASPQPVSA